MAHQVDEVNFWLPSEFITEDELLMGFKTDRSKTKRFNEFRNAYVKSAETKSDEDDYIAGLTRKLAYTTLGISNFSTEDAKGRNLSGSPQSTLRRTMTGSGCMPGLNRVSRVSSPPDGEDAASWLSLLAAAEKVRLIEETASFCSANPFVHPRKPDITDPNQGSGFYPNPHDRLSYQQLQAAQFQQLMQQQQQGSSYWGKGKIGHQEIVRNVKKNGGQGNQSLLSMASRPSAQQSHPQRQPSSGMRAVFLGESESKSKRTGTGVFLPRKLGAPPVETRKKTGCPVLLPDRVVNALNLNIKSMDVQFSQALPRRSDLLEANAAALKHRNTVSMVEQRRNLRPVPAGMGQELKLPQEWTY